MQEKSRLVIILTTVFLLLIPLIGMQFTNEIDWTLFDFAIAGALLMGFGLILELVIRKVKNSRRRIVICLTLLIILLFIWAELAVGIFGTPFSGN